MLLSDNSVMEYLHSAGKNHIRCYLLIPVVAGIYSAKHAPELFIADKNIPECQQQSTCHEYDLVGREAWVVTLVYRNELFLYVFLEIKEYRRI
jgi:hypothetical protein